MTRRFRPGRADVGEPISLAPDGENSGPATTGPERLPRPVLLTETWLVLGVSLGASGIWSALSLLKTWLEAMQRNQTLSQSTSTLNGTQTTLAWLDLVYQLVGIALALVPVLLAVHLMRRTFPNPLNHIGFDVSRPGRDASSGLLLTAVIGIPGLGLYLAARSLGVNTTVVASGLGDHWWTVPVLVLAAAQNAVLEEVIMVGYLFTRWSQAGWGKWRIILTSAMIRGSYHLYQGLGGFVGNVIMGAIFGWAYTRTRRVLPLVIAHTLLDVFAFVGYALLKNRVHWL